MAKPWFRLPSSQDFWRRHKTAKRGARRPGNLITHQEAQVLQDLKTGHSNREIALSLSISKKTVKLYMSIIMPKLGAKNRVEALAVYQRARTGDLSFDIHGATRC